MFSSLSIQLINASPILARISRSGSEIEESSNELMTRRVVPVSCSPLSSISDSCSRQTSIKREVLINKNLSFLEKASCPIPGVGLGLDRCLTICS